MKMPAAAIREEIHKNRVISFARFMELALYCPETGYYETKRDRVGRRGDFITSVSVGSLFGELLAFQFAEWLEPEVGGRRSEVGKSSSSSSSSSLAGQRSEVKIVEAGAHDGRLAEDILAWLRVNRPGLLEQIEYVIIEPSLRRQEWQRETLKAFAARVRWLPALDASRITQHAARFKGIIFSNELLDAFPVHRFGWDAAKQAWFEWGVTLEGDTFCWSRIQYPEAISHPRSCGGDEAQTETVKRQLAGEPPALPLPPSILQLPPALLAVLPDGYAVETSPAAEQWWGQAAGMLAQGKLLTIDYGDSAEERFSPARLRGTLRAYSRHRVTDDLLADPGGQDLTAHVNFAALQTAGEAAGLRTEQFCTQPQFLTRILQAAIAQQCFAPMDAKQVRQFQTLTHPEHLGRAFRVLVQGRESNVMREG